MKLASLVSSLLTALLLLALTHNCAQSQDQKPDPADVEAVRAVMKKATTALIEEDAQTFMNCCDSYVDCFFADGTLLKGKRQIESTLNQFFARRPADLGIMLDSSPRSYRVLSPEIITVDWPARIIEGKESLKVNTMTTLRKLDGQWYITSYLESVPYLGPVGGRNRGPAN